MATGDKLVKLDGLKAVYDKQNANVAMTEASTTASTAHAAGSYFILGGVLYQATVDIAQGGTITPGTNCVAAPLGAAVSELKSALEAFKDGTRYIPIAVGSVLEKFVDYRTGKLLTGSLVGHVGFIPLGDFTKIKCGRVKIGRAHV